MESVKKTLFGFLLLVLCAGQATSAQAQNETAAKRPMTIEDVRNWQRVTHKAISNNGLWVAATTERWRGDGDRNGNVPTFAGDAFTTVYDAKGNAVKTFGRGKR